MNDSHRRIATAIALLIATTLTACTTPHGNYRKDSAHEQLLQTLRQCLVEVPIRGDRNKEFISPCIATDVSSLNGIPRGKLTDALGPPRFCTGKTPTDASSFPTKDDCPTDQNPQWSFYRHPDALAAGGGPELICEANGHTYCDTVIWRRSQ
jgi:hypothetical protein